MNKNDSLLLKQRVFPSVERQVLTWNSLFPGIGGVDDRHILNRPAPEGAIQVCFPRMDFLAEGGAKIYAILRIREVLDKLCEESGTPFYDDCKFFCMDTLKEEEAKIEKLEQEFCQAGSDLVVAPVQFWLLHQEGNRFPTNQIPMSVSHAAALLCIVQGGPRKLWEGCNQDYWFSCPGSPASSGGVPCFDFFHGSLCLTPLSYLEKPKGKGGAASLFIN